MKLQYFFPLKKYLSKTNFKCYYCLMFLGYDMSPFIRRYSKYLNEKALSYRTVAFDFCKVRRR